MKATLLFILLASTCLLHVEASIAVYAVDVKKLAGKWYPVAVVLKNREPVNSIRVDDTLEAADQDLILTMRDIVDGRCRETEVHVVHTNEPGIFEVPATNEIVYMVYVDYKNYHIVHVEKNDSYGMYLLSRIRGASDYIKTKFKSLAETLGYDVNEIIYENLAESCP